MPQIAPIRPLLTVADVADELGASEQVVYQMIRAGLLPAVKISPRRIRIPRGAWIEWLNAQTDEALAGWRQP